MSQRNLADPISLTDLAAVAGLSRMHFAAQFRRSTGFRPHEYVLDRRIEYARRLLVSSDLSLIEIALSAGFADQAHFSRVFKQKPSARSKGKRHRWIDFLRLSSKATPSPSRIQDEW